MTELRQAQTEMGRRIDATSVNIAGYDEYYDLDEQPCTRGRWAELYETCTQWDGGRDSKPRWIVGRDTRGRVQVSTVWLGMNHRLMGDGPPLIYETMIFGGWVHDYCERYATRAEAEAGHKRACDMAFAPWWGRLFGRWLWKR